MMRKPEYRLISRSGQDRSVKQTNYARTTDKGILMGLRYSLISLYNRVKSELTSMVSYNEKKFALIFPWAQYHVSPTISGLDQLKNSGPNKILDHVKTELQAAKEDVQDAFGTGLYSSGTDPKSIIGARVFLSTSNTYGGVSQTSNSFLQAKIDSTTTGLSLSAMQARWEAAKEAPDAPNFITCVESIFNSFWNLLQPQQRFTDGEQAKAGFQNLLFNGEHNAPASGEIH